MVYQFPLKQHIGAASIAVVKTGAEVKRGTLLARMPENALGSNIYSSVDGLVTEVKEDCICVEAAKAQSKKFIKLGGKTAFERIKEAGIAGLGGAGFPTYAKLTKPFEKDGIVIVNAAECEPILNHNIVRITKRPEQLVRGLEIVMELVRASRGIIAIKAYHQETISNLRAVLQNDSISICELEDLYPMGEERAIVRETLGKLLPVTALPLEANAIVLNAETVCRVQEAVDLKKPFIEKDMTVAGKIRGNAQEQLIQVFLDVPLGTPVSKLFEQAGGAENHGLADTYGELIMGGPFTGKRTCLSAPVIKTTGGLIAAECFPTGPEKIGLLVCACGANEARMRELAESMGSRVVGMEFCKQAQNVRGALKCENPGRCPGQVQKILALKKAGAQAVLIGNCTDCSNTVMSCAPQMGLAVYHCTDGALRAVNHRLIRKIKQ